MPLSGEYVPSPTQAVREQIALYEQTGGREGNTVGGAPIVVITTIGARSGGVRKNAVMRVEHGGLYAVVASAGGRPAHPLWYHNLVAHPAADLQDGPTARSMRVYEAHGAERDTWWARAVEAWPAYADYQRSTDRQIPVMVLEPDE